MMASSARRLGQLAVQTRLSSALRPLVNPWICRRCIYKTSIGTSRWASSTTSSASPSGGEAKSASPSYPFLDTFPRRHVGPDEADTVKMLAALSPPVESLNAFVKEVIPADILSNKEMEINNGQTYTESQLVDKFNSLKYKQSTATSFIGAGYYTSITPPVIQRNVLESPAWYTSYTPYQPEISQGRLESLVNFQTMVTDLTALPISNASLLDEGTAAAEAMTLSMNALPSSRVKRPGKTFVVSDKLHSQTVAVLRGRADGFGIRVLELNVTSDEARTEIQNLGDDLVGVMVQYPDTYGGVENFRDLAALVHEQGSLLSCATDLLALSLLTPPGEWGADIAFGSAQRFGVPLGFGGPHAAFFAVTEKHKRKIPGRLVGLSKDRLGGKAYRLALQTREQHIRREKATSNVCTSQALLANMSALYAIYHGPEGIKAIAERAVRGARALQAGIKAYGFQTSASGVDGHVLFDTVVVQTPGTLQDAVLRRAGKQHILLRRIGNDQVGISVDEATTSEHLTAILDCFRELKPATCTETRAAAEIMVECLEQNSGSVTIPDVFRRTSSYLSHPVFNTHHSETELLRYIYHLQSKDLSLVHSMIPLGSCTMKLNGTTEMSLITDSYFSQLHPHAADEYAVGYTKMLSWFKQQLATITGMDGVSVQPNSGAQGEFAGLRTIREYLKVHGQGDKKRDICLIPVSAHGTNPASAAMAGMRVVPIKCDTKTGNLDLADLEAKCKQYQDELGAIMITYPSTFGVFEPGIKKVCALVHEHGGQVYMDGANMNAQIGLCSPGEIGADVCHLNLHKTFCIPHGGGGPGVGPICVKEHLVKHLPGTVGVEGDALPVSSAKYGSASINLISWAYNTLMGGQGLTHATKMTLLNANYLMSRLKPHYSILYTNQHQRCAHEFILDVRPFKETVGVEAIDIAKRLQDYGFHAPTMSWPVPNTLMIEPTESESKEELDRFVDALVSIREEIREVEEGKQPRERNVLKMAPHPIHDIIDGDGGNWDRSYSRDKAAYPRAWLREKKFWPTVGRVDDTYGDMNLFCTCPPVEDTTGDA
ncbi:glycine cleavage system P-protein-domain-containing protein [Pseudomassariella vexata]|uniref:Glycine cleavage system P protein n=1 Tax=Pseudomassariella vexata TaxID=1141098 RepID=A0A1Y2EAA8_9PEZI|nr:glycine cleavage system P-protein-domain-containing protein [Pseudomassariella vexata]ORY67795.1 glycine cleavage system P-protein-domain-containing protein [Pseudomassariella vexata]